MQLSDISMFISKQLNIDCPEDLKEEAELCLGPYSILINVENDYVNLALTLGIFLSSPKLPHLIELSEANFLGIKTGGFTFALYRDSEVLCLKGSISPGYSPPEIWDWCTKITVVADGWIEKLNTWEEFFCMVHEEKKTDSPLFGHPGIIKA